MNGVRGRGWIPLTLGDNGAQGSLVECGEHMPALGMPAHDPQLSPLPPTGYMAWLK